MVTSQERADATESKMLSAFSSYPLAQMAETLAFHTTVGKVFSTAILRMDNFINIALAFVVSSSIINFVQYYISTIEDPGNGHITNMIFSFTIALMWLLFSSVTDGYLHNKVGTHSDVTEEICTTNGKLNADCQKHLMFGLHSMV